MMTVVFNLLFQSLHVQRAVETRQDYVCIHLEGLDEIIVCALAHRLDADSDVIYTGDHQENQMGMALLHLRQQLHAGHPRHLQVRNYRIYPMCFEDAERLLAPGCFLAAAVILPETPTHDL